MQLLDIKDTIKVNGLQQVTSSNIIKAVVGDSLEFDEKGLLSEEIFGGVGTEARNRNFAYIDLGRKIIHPAVYDMIKKIFRNIEDVITGGSDYYIDKTTKKIIRWVDPTRGKPVPDQPKKGFSGIDWFIDNFKNIEFGETDTKIRNESINFLNNNLDTVFIDKFIVIPASGRDASLLGQDINMSDVNDLYLNVLRSVTQKNSSFAFGSEDIDNILASKIQFAVNDLYEWFKNGIAKKQGIIRSSMLSKRVDFSARSVIISDPKMKMGYVGIPRSIAIKLFEPFVMHQLKKDKVLMAQIQDNTSSSVSLPFLKKIFDRISKNMAMNIEGPILNAIMTALDRAVDGKCVLLKRDPALHRGSMQSFDVNLVDGNAIHLHPYCVGEFGADFDGDTMAVYTPITVEAQKEIRAKVHVSKNLISAAEFGKVVQSPSKDVALGAWSLTRIPSKKFKTILSNVKLTDTKDIETKISEGLHIYSIVKYKGKSQTVGQALWDSIYNDLDETYTTVPIKAKDTTSEIQRIYDLYFKLQPQKVLNFMDEVKRLGFMYSSIGGISIILKDMEEPEFVTEAKKKLTAMTDPIKADEFRDEVWKKYQEWAEKTEAPIMDVIRSGALSGSKANSIKTIVLWKGFVNDAEGNLIKEPLSDNFTSGYSARGYFDSGKAAVKGISDRVINTSIPGDLSRKLVFGTSSIVAHPTLDDCGTKLTFELLIKPEDKNRFNSRWIVVNNKLVQISGQVPEKYIGTFVNLRSPIYCRSKKLCRKCTGDVPVKSNAMNIGRVSATTVGERGTQLIMQTFHTGGVVTLEKIDFIDEVMNNML